MGGKVVRDQGDHGAATGHPQLGRVAHGRQQGRVDLREPVLAVEGQIGAVRAAFQYQERRAEAVADLEDVAEETRVSPSPSAVRVEIRWALVRQAMDLTVGGASGLRRPITVPSPSPSPDGDSGSRGCGSAHPPGSPARACRSAASWPPSRQSSSASAKESVRTRRAPGKTRGSAVQHAVHVGPDLDLLGAQGGAHDGGREVRPLLAEGGGDPLEGGAHVAAEHRHPPGAKEGQQGLPQPRSVGS